MDNVPDVESKIERCYSKLIQHLYYWFEKSVFEGTYIDWHEGPVPLLERVGRGIPASPYIPAGKSQEIYAKTLSPPPKFRRQTAARVPSV